MVDPHIGLEHAQQTRPNLQLTRSITYGVLDKVTLIAWMTTGITIKIT